jgi:hypothetical protein
MKIDSGAFLPKARSKGIIIKEIDGELLIYDRARDQAHCLNETAAAVWNLCDGRTSVSEISGQWAVSSEQKADGSRQKAEGSRQKAEGRPDTAGASGLTSDTLPPPPDTQIVWLALDQLRRSHLLEEATDANEKPFWPAAISGLANMSRREAVRRIGLGAAIALPIVMTMTAPTPAEAAVSCKHHCVSCTSPIECCGTCSTNVSGCVGPPMCT